MQIVEEEVFFSIKKLMWAALFASIATTLGVAQADDSIPIGVLVTQSPPGSPIQGKQVLDGLHIAQDMINSGGGVNGNPLKLLVEDTSGLPEKGRSGAESLITRDHVVAITGEHQSSVCLAEIPVAHKYNVPFVNTNCWSDAVRKKGYEQVFNPSPWNSLVSNAMAETIISMGVKSVVALAENTDYGIDQAKVLGQVLKEKAPDVSYSYKVLDREAHDYSSTLIPLRLDPPEMVATIMLAPAGYLLINQLHEQGIAPSGQTWLFDGAGISDNPDFWDNVSDAGQYMIALGFYHPEMQLTSMGEEVSDRYMDMRNRSPGRLVFEAADSLFSIAGAIEDAGSTDSDAIISALDDGSFDGTRGPMTFSDEPGASYHQWLGVPYVVYQFTSVDKDVKDTTLISGSETEVDTSLLEKP